MCIFRVREHTSTFNVPFPFFVVLCPDGSGYRMVQSLGRVGIVSPIK